MHLCWLDGSASSEGAGGGRRFLAPFGGAIMFPDVLAQRGRNFFVRHANIWRFGCLINQKQIAFSILSNTKKFLPSVSFIFLVLLLFFFSDRVETSGGRNFSG